MDNLVIRDARVIFRNFSGEQTAYNAKGDRNFCVIIDDEEYAGKLIEDGWNVKIRAPREEGEDVLRYLKVSVAFSNYPPKIILNPTTSKEVLGEETVGELDFLGLEKVDISISPYEWEFNGKTGVKAYLKTMYVTVSKDEFEDDYEVF